MGRIISGFDIAYQFQPQFYSAWYEIENNTLVQHNKNFDWYLGQTYEFTGGAAYFIPFDEIPEHIELKWEEWKQFDAGKVVILDVLYIDSMNRTLNFYFVEFPSGEKGLLYFWIGNKQY